MKGLAHDPKTCPLCARLRHPSRLARTDPTAPTLPTQKADGDR